MSTTLVPTIYIKAHLCLPDKAQWQFRFEVHSETSNRVYVVSQHKQKKHWGCSCPAYRTRRHCKHLVAIGLPTNEQPYEPNIIKA
jgi:hypothetical protein